MSLIAPLYRKQGRPIFLEPSSSSPYSNALIDRSPDRRRSVFDWSVFNIFSLSTRLGFVSCDEAVPFNLEDRSEMILLVGW